LWPPHPLLHHHLDPKLTSLRLKAGADALHHPGLTSSSGLQLSVFHVVSSSENPTPTYPNLKDIDAVLLTGSKHNSFDNDPWIVKLVEFTAEVLKQRRVRIIGVCFGHQIVGRAMGVKLGRNENGWEASVVAIDLTKKGQEIFGQNSLVGSPSEGPGKGAWLTLE
jgi:GMP synthase-like glutamine amidotransferase